VQLIMTADEAVVEGRKSLDPRVRSCPEYLAGAWPCQRRLARRWTV